MKVGRPTEYKPKYCDKLIKFFSKDRFSEITIVTTGKNDYCKEEPKRLANELPTFEKFAEIIGVSRDTLYEWSEKHKEFSDTMDYCRGIQKDFLIQNGLLGLYASNFAIFVAKNLTDMRDVVEVDHTINKSLDEMREKLNSTITYVKTPPPENTGEREGSSPIPA